MTEVIQKLPDGRVGVVAIEKTKGVYCLSAKEIKGEAMTDEELRLRNLLHRAWDMVHEIATDYYVYTTSKFNPRTGTYTAMERALACGKCHRMKGTPHADNCIVAEAEKLLAEMEEFK